ncbi:MAG: hypothetical protein A3I77_08070 [Gammaproteobacteria bacterium RIFCSPLOWO2_02_FULL_42_14]|nr:MAG: hypothetical protein A3B71_03905 [Gammaproteobacteria bacterium RIFCSPHIGHO2_02_FULL_42_43]OGT52935.1 MAG: hypothetical protein A3E54_07620 [Gammaproteobacteria bacterium RIFCSPHIGHO2_12_FULL_41_25]OGT61291.1 MAG: hypothetical protein A3I77_08070 [Gammaproteobacteria bacterium RIFCSPLOWO2_02_FULL_42_14]OGT87220.1 MAG: hypothetical protein A3G86_01795 [Gammaproteobacteria bacterium RIFCSPLOWO2_12_FULL_42_18]
MGNPIRWQCRRGMLELDVIFERYLANRYDTLSPDQKKLFSQLLSQDDPTLYDWLIVESPCADAALQLIVNDVIRYG